MFFYESWLNLPFEGMKKVSKMHIIKAGNSGQFNELIFKVCETDCKQVLLNRFWLYSLYFLVEYLLMV